jgi:hypothetical protein
MVENMDSRPIPKKRRESGSDAQLNYTKIVCLEIVVAEMEENPFVARSGTDASKTQWNAVRWWDNPEIAIGTITIGPLSHPAPVKIQTRKRTSSIH